MQIDTKTIKKHFQKSLDKYPQNALVQKLMAQHLAEKIKGASGNFLEIGSGSGLLTKELAGFKYNCYYANDLVGKSELYVKKYIPAAKFFAGDFRRIKFDKKFDMIVSNAVFQWCENIEKVFAQCNILLEPNGILAFSTFLPENFKEFKKITGLSLDYKSIEELQQAYETWFDLIAIEQFEYKMHFDNPLQILVHMKNTGVNSLSKTKWGIKEVKSFCERYKTEFPDLCLTYAPAILILKKKNT